MKKFEYLQITDDQMEVDFPATSLDESVQKALKDFGYKRFYFKKDKK